MLLILRWKTSWKSASFRIRLCFIPYLHHYNVAFAFSNLPYLHFQQYCLRFTCLVCFTRSFYFKRFEYCGQGENTGLPSSVIITRIVKIQPVPRQCLRWRIPTLKRNNRLPTFWLKPINSFGFVSITRFISCSLSFIFLFSLAPQELAISSLSIISHDFIDWLLRSSLSGSSAQHRCQWCTIPRLLLAI